MIANLAPGSAVIAFTVLIYTLCLTIFSRLIAHLAVRFRLSFDYLIERAFNARQRTNMAG
jgi:hypothetical protein